jgi:four helix bundle protein
MIENQNSKRYDLEDRTFRFAKEIRRFVKKLPRTVSNYEDVKQLVRASGSVGANYIEANESLSKKDFRLRIRISRKEAKECIYWLRLVDIGTEPALERERESWVQEGTEIMKILAAILRNTE